jgi:SAM-dependent methyltransferase
MEYFSFHHSTTNTYNDRFVRLLGPPREPEAPFFTARTGHDLTGREHEAERNQYYADVAASVQRVLEEVLIKIARRLHEETGSRNLVMAGGVALNSVANGRLLRETPFDQIYIQPNAGDAGGALGAALYVWHAVLGNPRRYVMEHAYYGEEFSDVEIRRFLHEERVPYEMMEDDDTLVGKVVEALCAGQVVGFFQGRAEWGPRALGNRSILADPRRQEMTEIVNTKIKFREPFRPFAPAVPEECATEYFDLGKAAGQYPQRFMMIVTPVHPQKQAEIPAVSHMGTARLQTVTRETNPIYYDIIRRFGDVTGVPVVLNTSLNLRSEPMASSPRDAFNTFKRSGLDLLVLGRFLVSKEALDVRPAPMAPAVTVHEEDRAEQYVDWLLCPVCRGSLTAKRLSDFRCTDCSRQFSSENDIPLLFWPTEDTDVDDVTEMVKAFYEENPFPSYEGRDTASLLLDKAREGVFAKLMDDQIPHDAAVLEVGCGTGQFSNFLGIRGRTVFGADMCLNSLSMAEAFRTENLLGSVHFVQMNLFRPVFPEKSFDVVICNGVLHHTPDPRGGFESISRLVRPGGHIVIGLYNKWGRLSTDLRRVLFRMSGNRLQWLDPYLKRSDVDAVKKRIWFMDQYKNPHESKHTLDEVIGWFAEAGYQFENSIPKPKPFAQIGEYEPLFRTSTPGSPLQHSLAELRLALVGGPEGGFFTVIGQRRES